jgi:hypothetical protein
VAENERKEQHLLRGLILQILLIALLVFAYTQAFRQLKKVAADRDRLNEQITIAREEVARQAVSHPHLVELYTQARQLQASWVRMDHLAPQAAQLKRQAQSVQFKEVRIQVAEMPQKTLQIPLEGKEDLKVDLYPLELTALGTTWNLAQLLAEIQNQTEPLMPLVSFQLQAAPSQPDGWPVSLTVRWLVPVGMTALPRFPGLEPLAKGAPPSPNEDHGQTDVPVEWGNRLEPFLSPIRYPQAMKRVAGQSEPFRLTGILWDPKAPTCLINGTVVKPGDRVGDATVVLIAPHAVLLERSGEEILLFYT